MVANLVFSSPFNLCPLTVLGSSMVTPLSISNSPFSPYHVTVLITCSYYGFDISDAPWLVDKTSTAEFVSRVGWMVEALSIDPFDSNHCKNPNHGIVKIC